jgi:hypothetical protein
MWHSGNLTNLNQLTNGPGYLTGITSGQVTGALGYTPYNSSNPSGYITSSGSISGNAGSVTNGVYTNSSSAISGDNHMTFGPNSTWSSYIRVGGNGRTVSGDAYASMVTTNGNLHLDGGNSRAIYLNYYAGTSGTAFGNGASNVVAWMGPDGDLWKGATDNTGSQYIYNSGTWGISITGNSNYATTAGSAPNGGNINSNYDVAAGVGNGLRFWNGSSAYKISMGVGALYQYGPVTDYSIKAQMNDGDTGRGFTWGRESYAPIAALNSTSGDMQIAGSLRAAGHLFTSYNGNNILLRTADAGSDAGILAQNSSGAFKFQIYGNGGDYGFLNGNWAGWDIRKTISGAMYMNNDSTYYLQTNSTSNFYALNIQGNAVVHAGNIGSQSVSYATSAQVLSSTNYIIQRGSNGSWNADFTNTPAGTMSYGGDLGANGTNGPGGSWWIQQNFRHTNSSNYWGTQVAWGWEDNANRLATRNITGGSYGGWVYYLNSSNFTSYAPSLQGSGAYGTWSINVTGSAGSAGSATSASQLTKYGDIYGDNWNTYYVGGKLIVSAALGMSGANKPPTSYDYGVALSYGEAGGPLMQMYFPENSGNIGTIFRKGTYRTGWNGNWSTWKTFVEQEGNLCTIAGGNGTGLEVHGNVGYNQDPLTYFLLRGQADTSWKALKIRLTGDAGGQDIEFRRIAENGTDSRMFFIPRGVNTVNFDYPIVQPSDSRLKDNITPISTPVEKIKSLRGVEFDWNSGEHVGTHDVGLIAQDVEAVLPEAVTTQEDGYKNLAYTKVIPLLVEAMKEQQTMIEALRAEIELLKNK